MVHFYTIGDEHVASSRMRVWHVARELKSAHDITVISPRMPVSKRARLFSVLFFRLITSGKRDIFYVHKIAAPPEALILFLIARMFRKRVLYDFDDERTGRLVRMLIRRATAVVVSSHVLQEDVAQIRKQVFLVPTTVPMEYYRLKDVQNSDRPIVIGWIGSGKGQIESLRVLVSVLRTLVENGESFVFRLVGAEGVSQIHEMFSGVRGLRAEIIDHISWEDERSIGEAVRQFDIGVMPLTDTSRNRRKAAFKIIQYMASGLPVVASAVGENMFVVENEKSGFLVAHEQAWVAALTTLLHDTEMRRRFGLRGRQIVEDRYALDRMQSVYEDILT